MAKIERMTNVVEYKVILTEEELKGLRSLFYNCLSYDAMVYLGLGELNKQIAYTAGNSTKNELVGTVNKGRRNV